MAHLGTADAAARPHVVPVCFALIEARVYIAIDEKPKGDPLRLRRVRNVVENAHAAIVFDEYSDDWSRLGFVLLHGTARLVQAAEERAAAIAALRARYAQYRAMALEERPLLAIDIQRATAWGTASRRGTSSA